MLRLRSFSAPNRRLSPIQILFFVYLCFFLHPNYRMVLWYFRLFLRPPSLPTFSNLRWSWRWGWPFTTLRRRVERHMPWCVPSPRSKLADSWHLQSAKAKVKPGWRSKPLANQSIRENPWDPMEKLAEHKKQYGVEVRGCSFWRWLLSQRATK